MRLYFHLGKLRFVRNYWIENSNLVRLKKQQTKITVNLKSAAFTGNVSDENFISP